MADVEANARRRAQGKKPAVISSIAQVMVQRIDALFDIEREINGQRAEVRKAARQDRTLPLVLDLEAWMKAQRAKLSRNDDLAKAFNYLLNRWPAFTFFLDDERVCLSNNAAERALRGIATQCSLYTPSSSICKHWNLNFRRRLTRAPFTPHRSGDARIAKMRGVNLVRSPPGQPVGQAVSRPRSGCECDER